MDSPAAEEEQQRVVQLCLDVVRAVRAAAREARSLTRVWAELSRDLAALLCGMRPAVMLDYVLLPGTTLLAIVNSLRMHDTGRTLVVAGVDGCFYVLRPDLVLQQVSVPAHWVAFQQHGMDTTCHWASAAQVQAVQQQVAAVASTIAGHAEGESPHTVLLLDMPGMPIMPTISGWLLGYPVIYLVDAGNVDAAARLLSSVRLALHTVVASCPALKEAAAREGGAGTAQLEVFNQLCSFTVPAHLLCTEDGRQWPSQQELLAGRWLARASWTSPVFQVTEVVQQIRL